MNIETCPGGPTGEEVAAVALQKLGEGSSFLDVGCGTGFVSVLASRRFDEVFAVDRRDVAVETARRNFGRHGVEGDVVKGEAPGALSALPSPDAAFLGGSRNLEEVVRFLEDARVVASCARLETVTRARDALERRDRFEECVMIDVAEGYDLEGGTAFTRRNPVYLVVGSRC